MALSDLIPTLAADPSAPTGTATDIQRRRALADALMQKGADFSPISSPWQGVGRLLQGAMGGIDAAMLDRDQKAGQAADAANLGKMLQGMNGQNAATPTATALAAGLNPDGGGSSSLPTFAGGGSGVSMPAGAQRDLMIRTIAGEAGGESPEGQAAVAHVIMNRAGDGKYGPNIASVIMAPKQFSVWNPGDPAGNIARNLDPNSPQYQRIGQIVDGVTSGNIPDPTGGARNYYNPRAASPSWGPQLAQSNDVTIGSHRFVGGGQPVRVASLDPSAGVTAYAPSPMPTQAGAAIDTATIPMPPRRPDDLNVSPAQRIAGLNPNTTDSTAGPPTATAPNVAASDVTTGPQYAGTGVPGAVRAGGNGDGGDGGDDGDGTETPVTSNTGPARPAVTTAAPVAPAAGTRPVLNSRVAPEMLQTAIRTLNNPYASPASQQVARSILSTAFAKTDSYSEPYKDQFGNVVQRSAQTGKIEILNKAAEPKDERTATQKDYEYYVAQAKAAGQKPMAFDAWSTAKARAAAANTTVNVPIDNGKAVNAGQVEAYKLDAEAVRKGQNEGVPALDAADENIALMKGAMDRNGGALPTGGVLARMGLDFGRMQSYLRDSYGINVGNPDELANLEVMNKGGIRLGGDMAKAVGGNRVLKTEFDMAQKVVPGLETSNGGNRYMLDALSHSNEIKRDYYQAQEDFYRSHNYSLDGFQKSWRNEISANPRPLSTFPVVKPVDAGDGSQFVKLPSTGKGGYSWFRRGADGATPITDPAVASRLDAQAPMPDMTKPASPTAPTIAPQSTGRPQRMRFNPATGGFDG